jgi:hypothetical protein
MRNLKNLNTPPVAGAVPVEEKVHVEAPVPVEATESEFEERHE